MLDKLVDNNLINTHSTNNTKIYGNIGSNSTKYPASCTGNVSEPRLTSQVGKVCHVDQRVSGNQSLGWEGGGMPVFVCLRSSCNHMTEVGGPKGL